MSPANSCTVTSSSSRKGQSGGCRSWCCVPAMGRDRRQSASAGAPPPWWLQPNGAAVAVFFGDGWCVELTSTGVCMTRGRCPRGVQHSGSRLLPWKRLFMQSAHLHCVV